MAKKHHVWVYGVFQAPKKKRKRERHFRRNRYSKAGTQKRSRWKGLKPDEYYDRQKEYWGIDDEEEEEMGSWE